MRGVGLVLLLGLAGCSNATQSSSGGLTAGAGAVAAAGGTTAGGGGGGSAGEAIGGTIGGTAGGGAANGGAGSANSGGEAGTGGAVVAGAGGADATDAATMVQPIVRVMTFNVRYDTAEDGDDAWPVRRPLTYDVFTRQQADLVGIQEALDSQLVDIDGAVEGYSRIGVGRDDGEQDGEYSAIYYRNERFVVDSSGTFWFSDTPEV
ncbi:MAG TPA: hypothetical protein VHO25_17950, partial [Polyangiaceae bacterium]|nr:hypothetical protein [Polyangiaceae bacterium]